VCGLSPIYAALAAQAAASDASAPLRGRTVAYAQCPADEDGGSVVSIASVVFD
jgi:hypothetical protein